MNLNAGNVQTRYRGKLKEMAGFLDSRSLTLPLLHPEREALCDDCP